MTKIPEIHTKIVNDTLQPYFNSLYAELRILEEPKRTQCLKNYQVYIETEAQKSHSWVIRMQLRINMQALIEKLGESLIIEVNVKPRLRKAIKPRFSDEAYYEIPGFGS